MASSKIIARLEQLATPEIFALSENANPVQPSEAASKIIVRQNGTDFDVIDGNDQVAGLLAWAKQTGAKLGEVSVSVVTSDDEALLATAGAEGPQQATAIQQIYSDAGGTVDDIRKLNLDDEVEPQNSSPPQAPPIKMAPDRSEHLANVVTKAIQSGLAGLGGTTPKSDSQPTASRPAFTTAAKPSNPKWSQHRHAQHLSAAAPRRTGMQSPVNREVKAVGYDQPSSASMLSPANCFAYHDNRKMASPDVEDSSDVQIAHGSNMPEAPMASPRNVPLITPTLTASLPSPRLPGRTVHQPQAGRKALDNQSPVVRQAVSVALERRSNNIKQHEERHSAALRDVDPSAKPEYKQIKGPDGKSYAVAGEVNTNVAPIPGRPDASEKKADAIFHSAMHDEKRSKEDNQVGRQALEMKQQAAQEKRQLNSPDSDDAAGPTDIKTPAMQSPKNVAMQSPYSVSMKNPVAAAIPAIASFARGALAVGSRAAGFVARGARAAGRAGFISAPAARRVRRGAVAARQGARIGSEVIQNNTRAFEALNSQVDKATGLFGNFSQKMRMFSPEVAQQSARNQMNQFNLDRRTAGQLGKPLAQLEAARGALSIRSQESGIEIAKIFVPIATQIVNLLNGVLVGVNAIFKTGNDILDHAGKTSRSIYENVPLVKDVVYYLSQLYEWAKKWIPKVDLPKDFNLKDFLKIEVPPAGAKAQVQGPNFNMPIAQFNPLPMAPVGGGLF